jgi:hypothetical protein
MPFTAECFFCHLLIQNVPDSHRGVSKQCPRCQNLLTLAEMSRSRPVSALRDKISSSASPGPAVVDHPVRANPNPEHRTLHQTSAIPHVASALEVIAPAPHRAAPAAPPSAGGIGRSENRSGLFAFCFASLAFMAMAIPGGVWFATALALGALLCGSVCLASSSVKSLREAAAFPGLAVATGVLICLAYSHWPLILPGSKAARRPEAVTGQALVHLRTEGVSRHIETKDVEWVDANTDAAQIGNVRVRIASAAVEAVGPTGPAIRPARPEKRLVVRLRVSNAGASQVEHYQGWNAFLNDPASAGVQLRDEQGHVLRSRSEMPINQSKTVKNAEIPPEKWVDDLLVFETPPGRTSDLRLELPGAAIGSKDKLLFRIPRAMIQKPADGPAAKPSIK